MQNKTLGLYYTKPEKDIKISLETHTHVLSNKKSLEGYTAKSIIMQFSGWVYGSFILFFTFLFYQVLYNKCNFYNQEKNN